MNKCTILTTSLFLAIPSVAAAAPAAAADTAATSLITAVTAALTAGAALVTAWRGARRARAAANTAADAVISSLGANERAAAALAWSERQACAHSDGVVLVLTYPGCKRSAVELLRVNGWRVMQYCITRDELERGTLLPGPHLITDVTTADAIVVEGLDPANVAKLAAVREFRDNIRAGAGVSLYTGGENHRYDLAAWGECDQGVTTPVTTEAAVRASLARREATVRRQGIRPGQLAAARQALIGSHRDS